MNKSKIFGIVLAAISSVGTSITGYSLDNKTESHFVKKHAHMMQYSDLAIKNMLNKNNVA